MQPTSPKLLLLLILRHYPQLELNPQPSVPKSAGKHISLRHILRHKSLFIHDLYQIIRYPAKLKNYEKRALLFGK